MKDQSVAMKETPLEESLLWNGTKTLSRGSARLAWLMAIVLVGLVWASPAWAQDDEDGEEVSEEADEEVTEEMETDPDAADPEASPEEAAPTDTTLLGATPTLYGATGLFHTVSADTGFVGSMRLSLFTQYFSGEDVVRTNDEASRFIGTLAFSITPLEGLEPYLVLAARSSDNTFGIPQTVLAQGDSTLGTKAVYAFDKTFKMAADVRLFFLTGSGSTTFDFSAASFQLLGALTYDATALDDPTPVRVHLNLGYLADNSDQLLPEDANGAKIVPSRVERFTQGVSAFDQIRIGAGVEFPFDSITPHLEYNLGVLTGDEPDPLCQDQPLNCPSEAGFAGNPQTLTIGVKGAPLENLILNGGVDLGLTGEDVQGVPATPSYNVVLGLSYIIDPRPKIVEKIVEREKIVEVAPEFAWGAIKVVDASTGKPVQGAVASYSDPMFSDQLANSKDGSIRTYNLEAGNTLSVEIKHPEYKTAKISQKLEKGANTLEVKLKTIGDMGTITGVAKAGGKPVNGTARLVGPKKTYSVPIKDGAFTQRVLTGDYTVTVAAPGYLTAGRDVRVTKGKTNVSLRFIQRPPTSQVSVQGNKILIEGRIDFDKDGNVTEESQPLIDQIAAVLFERPEFKRVRIESHVDDRTGGRKEEDRVAFTDARAKKLRSVLAGRGVNTNRLEAKGFGSSMSLVPNSSKANRAINTRIELTIVSKGK